MNEMHINGEMTVLDCVVPYRDPGVFNICYIKILLRVLMYFRSLQSILSELHDYHNKQEQWLKHQEKLLWEQAPLDVRLLGQDHSSLSVILGNRGGLVI